MLTPGHLGLPEKFRHWRPHQFEAMCWAAQSPKRFIGAAMPTGTGKSLMYMAAAMVAEPDRVCVLTSTKGLQDQLGTDFGAQGLYDVRGQSNYQCELEKQETGNTWVTVDQGICHLGVTCLLKNRGCHYYDAIRAARGTRLVVTNYSFWLASKAFTEGIGNFQLLVLDEAHHAHDELADHLAVRMDERDIALIGQGNPPADHWHLWANLAVAPMKARLENLKGRVPASGRPHHTLFADIRQYRSLVTRLEALATRSENWILEEVEGWRGSRSWRWDPIDVAAHAGEYLFRGSNKVLLTSATIRPRTLEMLGIQEEQQDFQEFPGVFPRERRPITHVSTVRMHHGGGGDADRIMLNRVDQIIARRQKVKGFIPTVSYRRAKYIMENSRFRHMMVTHTPATTRDVVSAFKVSLKPQILVSPSLSTGWDFPYGECRYIIVVKVPFPDMRAKVLQARAKLDKGLANYLAAVELDQTVGRGMRATDDWCEVIITDDNVTWFVRRNRKLMTRGFLEAFRSVEVVPPPLDLE